jgi:hypothetical protein
MRKKRSSRTFAFEKYKNTLALLASFVALALLADTPPVHAVVEHIAGLHLAGAVLAGGFFVSIFTLAPATLVLIELTSQYPAALIALFAGLGAVIGDYAIFRFFKDGVFIELKPLFMKFGGKHLEALMRKPGFRWLAPLLGAVIIASPFPDEVGIALMGVSKISGWQFAALTYFLNTAGIYVVLTLLS